MMNMAVKALMEYGKAFLPDAHTDAATMARLSKAAYEAGCFENYGVPFCMTIEAEEMGAKVDLGNETYEPRVKEYAVASVSEWRDLKTISLDNGRAKTVLEAIGILKDKNERIPVIGNIPGPVSVSSSLLEPTVYYKELRRKKKEAHEMMVFVTEQLVSFAKAQLSSGADVITISDPSGTGEILGPELFAEFMVPYINTLAQSLKEEYPSAPVIVHICGHMHRVYDLLNRLKCDALSFDACVNLKKAREFLANHTIMGNVSTYALEYGEPDTVWDITSKAMRDGADIISPACGLGSGTPLSNLRAMLKSVQERSSRAGN
jgi:[methyl-Co(III) methanol-specific corrinoid protein]:coenzyme M methyltransferase